MGPQRARHTQMHIHTHIYTPIACIQAYYIHIPCKHIHIQTHKYKYLILVRYPATEIPNMIPIIKRRKLRLREVSN